MSQRTKPPFRADHVGSLRRPDKLIAAHKAYLEDKFAAEQLRALQDEAVREAVAMQERVGLMSVTDGEMRRSSWRDNFFERVDGFSSHRIQSSFWFTEFSGERRRGMPVPVVVGRLKRRQPITADDFAYLRPLVSRTAKATIPSPTVNHFFSGDISLRGSPYRDRSTFLEDVAAIYREEIADLANLGCEYLQIDEVPMAVLCDPKNQDIVRGRGEDPDQLLDDYVGVINSSIRERPPTMTICVHLCRGNGGHGQASGGYDPIAERLFQKLDVNAYFLEYDTGRSGSFEPLRMVPKDKIVVLGLMSTKLRELESVAMLKRRVDEAVRFIDSDQLCLSPQCGFASSFLTDRFSLEDQERKLSRLVEAANEIWG